MEFISCRRYETLSLHYILQKFSTADCDWLMPPGPGARQQARVSVSDALKRRELMEDFLFWYFGSFVLPLLRVRFVDYSRNVGDFWFWFVDYLLCYGFIGVSQSSPLLPSRRLENVVHSSYRKTYFSHLRETL